MKISFFEIRNREKELLEPMLSSHKVVFTSGHLDESSVSLAKDAEIVSVFVGSTVNKDIIDALPNTKLILTRSTGFDHIDVKYANQKGILVAMVPAYGANTVAEFAFSLILNLSRKICPASARAHEGNFSFDGLQGFDLCGKTLGIIGTGKIGKNSAKIAKGFGMKILASDPHPDQIFAGEVGLEYTSLDFLLGNSDIVTIHAPYNENTFHLINKNNIGLIKKGSFLINTARGEIVETEALLEALKSGQISGAGLDVLEGERNIKSSIQNRSWVASDDPKIILARELTTMQNVIVTPHIAFFSIEAETEICKVSLENIMAFVAGSPKNIIEIK